MTHAEASKPCKQVTHWLETFLCAHVKVYVGWWMSEEGYGILLVRCYAGALLRLGGGHGVN